MLAIALVQSDDPGDCLIVRDRASICSGTAQGAVANGRERFIAVLLK